MRIAYLVFAHEQPRSLERLVGALECPGVSIFVHLDAKSDDREDLVRRVERCVRTRP